MSSVHGYRSRGFIASVAGMLASLLGDAPPPRYIAGQPVWRGPRVDRRRGNAAGAKLRRHAAERRLGLSPRGH